MTDVADTLDRLCYDHIERDDPIAEDDLAWLIDTVDRLTRWLERMPADTYRDESRLWKSWALNAPVLPQMRVRDGAA